MMLFLLLLDIFLRYWSLIHHMMWFFYALLVIRSLEYSIRNIKHILLSCVTHPTSLEVWWSTTTLKKSSQLLGNDIMCKYAFLHPHFLCMAFCYCSVGLTQCVRIFYWIQVLRILLKRLIVSSPYTVEHTCSISYISSIWLLCRTLNGYADKLPAEKLEECRQTICQFYGTDEITDDVLESACSLEDRWVY